MNLPFTTDQFLSIFEQYNRAVWPLQLGLNLLGLTAVFLAIRKITHSNRLIAVILAFYWLWIGLAYHYSFFTHINPAATLFAVLNVIQGWRYATASACSRAPRASPRSARTSPRHPARAAGTTACVAACPTWPGLATPPCS